MMGPSAPAFSDKRFTFLLVHGIMWPKETTGPSFRDGPIFLEGSKMVTQDIRYIGVDDKDLDLFEGQYPIPNGIAYNSYVILDEQVAVMDTVDARKTEAFMANLEAALAGRTPDYLVVQHVEPDHASSIQAFLDKFPGTEVIATAKALQMLPLYNISPAHTRAVKEGDTLSLGRHELTFVTAPMVHWPEVMVTYDKTDKVLFSADAFGKFGALDAQEDWDCEARRYYFNIVGKYGRPGPGPAEKGRRAGPSGSSAPSTGRC